MDASSPFRTAPLRCPRCPTGQLGEGALRFCGGCRGAWVPDDALHERVSHMQADLPQLAWRTTPSRPSLPCPECRAKMTAHELFGVPVDRCRAHGVWFDGGELAEVLHRSAAFRPATGVAAAAGAVVPVDTATASTSNVGSDLGVLDVVGGVLEILGDIFSIIDL